jgi:hypothetical protein
MTLIRLALVVLYDANGRVLVQLREPDKPYGGMWGLVGPRSWTRNSLPYSPRPTPLAGTGRSTAL